jgi:S1-C subfamily serine protease
LIQGDKGFVVTNRHVIERARGSVEIHFLRMSQAGSEERLIVPAFKTRIAAIHETVDLALVDVTAAMSELTA